MGISTQTRKQKGIVYLIFRSSPIAYAAVETIHVYSILQLKYGHNSFLYTLSRRLRGRIPGDESTPLESPNNLVWARAVGLDFCLRITTEPRAWPKHK